CLYCFDSLSVVTVTFSLHDALPIFAVPVVVLAVRRRRWLRLTRQASAEAASATVVVGGSTDLVTIDALGDRVEDEISGMDGEEEDRKSTRLNSSHVKISYAVFCFKK